MFFLIWSVDCALALSRRLEYLSGSLVDMISCVAGSPGVVQILLVGHLEGVNMNASQALNKENVLMCIQHCFVTQPRT